MLHLLTCPKGHSWEATADDAGAVGRAVCPVCGDAVDLLPLFDLALPPETGATVPEPVVPRAPLRDTVGKPVVAGFEIQDDLGRTPLGVRLFRAKQILVNRPVLLKVVVAGDAAGQMAWGSLRGEAAALGKLSHPNVIPILEAGERDRQLFYNALEWVDGPTLAEHAAGKALPPRRAALLVEALARAVHAAHEQGVVHRGLRPACVRLQPLPGAGDRAQKAAEVGPPFWTAGATRVLPRIADFGLARRPAEGDAADLELHDGAPTYVSPEQAWGRGREIGPATDVYALGAILYGLLAGRPPYSGRTPGETLDFIRHGDPPWLPALNKRLPADVAAVCRKAMHRRPNNRYKTALELADDLRAFVDGRPVRARPAGAAERFGKWTRRRPAAALLLLACLLAAVGALTAYLIGAGEAAVGGRLADAARERAVAAENREAGLRRDLAEFKKREQINDYYLCIGQADRAVAEGRADRARQLLADWPPEIRHWEWHYLTDRLDHLDHTAITLTGPEQAVACMAYSPDGRMLAAGFGTEPQKAADPGAKREVRVWALPSTTPQSVLTGFSGPILQTAFSPDGKRLATADGVSDNFGHQAGDVKVWEPTRGEGLASWHVEAGRPTDLAYSGDGKRLIVLDDRGWVHTLLPADLRELLPGLPGAGLWNNEASHLALLNPEGTKVAVVASDGSRVQIRDPQRAWAPTDAAQHPGDVLALCFNPEANLLASGGRDGTAQVWDVRANRLVCTLRGHEGAVTGVSFSHDGRRLAMAGEDGNVTIWDPITAREILRLTPFDKDAPGGNGVTAVAFSPGADEWGLATAHGNEVRIFLGPQGPF